MLVATYTSSAGKVFLYRHPAADDRTRFTVQLKLDDGTLLEEHFAMSHCDMVVERAGCTGSLEYRVERAIKKLEKRAEEWHT